MTVGLNEKDIEEHLEFSTLSEKDKKIITELIIHNNAEIAKHVKENIKSEIKQFLKVQSQFIE